MTENGTLVFRPARTAAIGAFFHALLTLAPFLVPFMVSGLFVAQEASPNTPWWLLLYENVGLWAGFALAFVPVARVLFTRYVVDEKGMRVTSRLFSKSDHAVPWEKVTAIEHHRTILDAALGLERLNVIAYGTRGTSLRLVGLRRASALRDSVAAAMRSNCTVTALTRGD